MHVVKAPNLTHMHMTHKKVNVAIVPSQISHVGTVAAIFFLNGRNVTISLKLRGEEPSLSTLYGQGSQKLYNSSLKL